MDPNHLLVDDSLPYYNALSQCIDHWGLVPEKTELVRDGVNHVFATEFVNGAPVIIRISDGNLRERGEVLGELLWLEHLIAHGCTDVVKERQKQIKNGTYDQAVAANKQKER